MFSNKANRELETKILNNAFQRAAEEGWHSFKLSDVAKDIALSPNAMKDLFPFKSSLLLALNKRADEVALGHLENKLNLRDKIFESFMQRFDIFQDYRDGIRSVLHALPKDPALAAILSTATMESMRWIADHVGLDRNGFLGCARLHNLFLIWLKSLHIWEKDITPDLSETMNMLNNALERAENLGLLKESYPSIKHHTPINDTPSASSSTINESEAETASSLPDFIEDEKK